MHVEGSRRDKQGLATALAQAAVSRDDDLTVWMDTHRVQMVAVFTRRRYVVFGLNPVCIGS